MSYVTTLPSAMPAAPCVPTNDLLYGPLGSIISRLAGGFGGLIMPTAGMMIMLAAVAVLVTVLTKKASVFMKAIGVVIGVALGLPLTILIVSAVYTMLNNACGVSPF